MTSPVVPPVGRVAGQAAGVVAVVVPVVTVAASVPAFQGSPFERDLPAWLVAIGLAAGAALATSAWSERRRRPQAAVGLAATSVALFVPGWAGWAWIPAILQAAVLAVAPLAVAGAVCVGLRWPRDSRSTTALRAAWCLAAVAAVVHLVGYDPLADPGCVRTCADVHALTGGWWSAQGTVTLVAALTVLAGTVAAPGLARSILARTAGEVEVAALVAVALFALPWIARVTSWSTPPSPDAQLAPGALGALVLGATPLLATVRARRIRREMQALIGRLSLTTTGDHPVADLRWDIAFAVPGEDGWVDAAGDPLDVEVDTSRSVVVADPAGPVLRLRLAPGADANELLASLTPATMLALRTARLAALSRARLREVRASQRRLVAASDAERERIERDLHDGAQQHLVSAAFQLSLAGNRLAATDVALAQADAAVRDALARLRALGHGIFPAALASEGLAAALEDLARDSDVPTTVDVPELDLERPAAVAAYAVAAAVLGLAAREAAAAADVTATLRDGRLRITLRLSGMAELAQDALVDVADRVGALDGRLAVEPAPGGILVTAEVPCGSSSPTM